MAQADRKGNLVLLDGKGPREWGAEARRKTQAEASDVKSMASEEQPVQRLNFLPRLGPAGGKARPEGSTRRHISSNRYNKGVTTLIFQHHNASINVPNKNTTVYHKVVFTLKEGGFPG